MTDSLQFYCKHISCCEFQVNDWKVTKYKMLGGGIELRGINLHHEFKARVLNSATDVIDISEIYDLINSDTLIITAKEKIELAIPFTVSDYKGIIKHNMVYVFYNTSITMLDHKCIVPIVIKKNIPGKIRLYDFSTGISYFRCDIKIKNSQEKFQITCGSKFKYIKKKTYNLWLTVSKYMDVTQLYSLVNSNSYIVIKIDAWI